MTNPVSFGPARHIPVQRTAIAAMASFVILKFMFSFLPQLFAATSQFPAASLFRPLPPLRIPGLPPGILEPGFSPLVSHIPVSVTGAGLNIARLILNVNKNISNNDKLYEHTFLREC